MSRGCVLTAAEIHQAPNVSIGMPVYNGEKFIRAALDSLLAQTFTDFELIISDNASTDGTEFICREYAKKDERVRYVRQAVNIGGVANFQFVLDEAVGEYFMWAACDDWWSSRFLEELHLLLDNDENLIVAFSRIQHVHVDGTVFRDYPHLLDLAKSENRSYLSGFVVRTAFDRYIMQNMIHGKVNIIYGLFRRSLLCQADIFRRWGNAGWGADLIMVACALRYGEVAFSGKSLWKKTESPDSEGSIKKDEKSSLKSSAFGVFETYMAYMNYVLNVWAVQGEIRGVPDIGIAKRITFVGYEFIRMNYGFLKQVFRALAGWGK
jgi:glycosyltransferase involved in cell wall biosynthesis